MKSLKKAFIVGFGSSLNIFPKWKKKRSKNNIDHYFHAVGQHFWRSMGSIYSISDEEFQNDIKKQIKETCPENQNKIIVELIETKRKLNLSHPPAESKKSKKLMSNLA